MYGVKLNNLVSPVGYVGTIEACFVGTIEAHYLCWPNRSYPIRHLHLCVLYQSSQACQTEGPKTTYLDLVC